MIALDLFAGTGWGVACQRLGIEERGVEIMPEARATRAANGMHTAYADVWEGLEGGRIWDHAFEDEKTEMSEYDLLIASPPCQTFSMAGGGAGRKALDDVLEAIETRAYMDPERLRAFGEEHDPRTALVLTPLAHVARDSPLFVVFEQVPPVLPVWERCAEEMRRWGYSVWTGIVNAEQYGVPQTRRRAILIARADGGEAKMPTPTHSRYYNRDPKRLDEGVLPWVSMAEALGWGMTERPFITAGNAVGRAEGVGGSGGKAAIVNAKETGAWRVGFARRADGKGEATADGYRARDLRTTDLPAQHVTEKVRSWTRTRPATTVQGDPRIMPPGHRVNGDDVRRLGHDEARERYASRSGGDPLQVGAPTAERVTVAEAAALQSYPPGFEFAGTKTKQFLQIGNAVPPLLAEAILREVTS
jgi:DNA (cytosine-5)-methyltransferase 1